MAKKKKSTSKPTVIVKPKKKPKYPSKKTNKAIGGMVVKSKNGKRSA